MFKLRALEAIDEQDGKFSTGDEFFVNDERASVLVRTGKAEMCADQTVDTGEATTRRRTRSSVSEATSA